MATIIDVAEMAGVSIKTVSRVMNNHAYVSDDTRERVTKAMKALDYAPSDAARRMRTGRSSLVGMLYGDPGSGYQSRLNHAMLQACSAAGVYLAAGLFDEGGGQWRTQLEDFLDRTRADKMVLVPPLCDSSILQDVLTERGIRFVLLSPSRATASAPSVAMDDHQAAREITSYLLGLGHRDIGYIGGDPDHVASLLRRQGYEEALIEAGMRARNVDFVREGFFSFRKSLREAQNLLDRPRRPTAIFAASDDMAAAIYMVAGRLGLSIPGDLSVVGFDGTPIARTVWPAMTTVAQPFEAMAEQAIALLNRPQSDWQTGGQVILPHDILYRESCAAPRAESDE